MDDLQNLALLCTIFLTTACAGFVVGVNLATPVKRQLLEQIRADLQKHLKQMAQLEEKNRAGGFRLIPGGRDDRPAS